MSAFPQELDNRVGITAFPASSRPLATTDAARCAPCVIDIVCNFISTFVSARQTDSLISAHAFTPAGDRVLLQWLKCNRFQFHSIARNLQKSMQPLAAVESTSCL